MNKKHWQDVYPHHFLNFASTILFISIFCLLQAKGNNSICLLGEADRPHPSEGREEQLRADRARAGPPGGDHQVHVQRCSDTQGQPLLPGSRAPQKV